MSIIVMDKKRQVIPRWRDFRTALEVGELGTVRRKPYTLQLNEESFTEKVEAWKSKPSVTTATELVGSALVFGREEEGVPAAEFVLSQAGIMEKTPALITSANALLLRASPQEEYLEEPMAPLTEELSRDRIHNLRSKLEKDVNNSLAWADLSREFAIIGEIDKAKKAMTTALGLVPDNRFLLRSASRFYVHLNEHDRAHDLLRRQPVTFRDPWLLSVEISISSILGKTSRFIKDGRRWINDNSLSPFDTSELASAIATLDLTSGDSKQARKLFRQSLLNPTDNAVGQASWASRNMSSFDLDLDLLKTPRTFEARGWTAYTQGNWGEAIANYEKWLIDQPFSSWPATVGSSLAGTILADYRRSEKIARIGLRANPTNAPLLNNHALALALLDRLDEADAALDRIKREDCEQTTLITSTATRGLLAFRKNNSEEGRRLYSEALNLCDVHRQQRYASLARLMLAQEEIRIGSDHAITALRNAMATFDKVRDRDFAPLTERLAKAIREQQNVQPARRTATVTLPDGQKIKLGR